jgi:dihydropteroate synthase
MGVLNRTPDSFSDGGRYLAERDALQRARSLVEAGAVIIDVGAESTRPGAERVDATEQLRRLGSVVRTLTDEGILVSVDTTSPEVAAAALEDGAAMINSVELEPARTLAELAHRHGAELCLMHSRGAMTSMAGFSAAPEDDYGDVVTDVWREWSRAAGAALEAGLSVEDVYFDPGLGFHKSARHSLELVARARELTGRGHPTLFGPSRKSFLAPEVPPADRLAATIASCLALADRGVQVLRVHDVAAVRQALRFREAVAGV